MVEAVTPTLYRSWSPERKASNENEHRDWYAERQAFLNEIDAEVQTLAPLNLVVTPLITDTSTPAANGTALLAALAHAKSQSPSATKRIAVMVHPGVYDIGTATLELDTECLDLLGTQLASCGNTLDRPTWTDVKRAGVRITSNNTADGVVKLTANDVIIVGIDTEQSVDSAAYSMKTDCSPSSMKNPTVVGCSFADYGIEFAEHCTNRFENCHSEGGFTGEATGTFIRCTASDRRSFDLLGASVWARAHIIDCSINYVHSGADDCTLDGAVFERCRIFGDRVFAMNASAGGSDSALTRFESCYIQATSLCGSSLYGMLGQLRNCECILTSPVYLGAAGEVSGGKVTVTGTNLGAVVVAASGASITKAILDNDSTNAVYAASTLTAVLTGCVLRSTGLGINAAVDYSGGNVVNGVWIDSSAGGVTTDGTSISGSGTSTDPLTSELWEAGSGSSSIVMKDAGNTCTGGYSVVIGQNNACSADAAIISGESNVIILGANYAANFGLRSKAIWFGSHVMSNGPYDNGTDVGISQNVKFVMTCETSGTTPGEMVIDPASLASAENVTLEASSLFSFRVRITGTTDSREARQWYADVIMSRTSTTGTTLTSSSVTNTVSHNPGTHLDATPTIAMESATSGRLKIAVVGTETSTDYKWMACVDGEVIGGISGTG